MSYPFNDPALPTEERVNDLISRMTVEEKVSQMLHAAPAIDRLGVPAYDWWNECLHGVGRAGIATVFPQAIGMAAAWNETLLLEVAIAISDEARAKHHESLRHEIRDRYTGLTFWTPNINIFRDPRWGRGQETYGEDPYLTARLGVVFVQGLQGEDDGYLKLVATPKHYAVHSGPEHDRHHFDAIASQRDMLETYLPHFEATVREGGAVSIMGAYNRTNGEACCASPTLLQKILRDQWGFDGYVVSDCGAIGDIYLHHKLVATAAEASAMAVIAGCDLNCGQTYSALLEAVEQGLIDEATLDISLRRLFSARFRLGMFDPPEMVPYAQIPFEVNDCKAHRELALQMARESMVLLKNQGGLLPLTNGIDDIAVIGPNADDVHVLLANYNGTPTKVITPLEGIRKKLSPKTKLYSAHGCDVALGFPSLSPIPSDYLRPVDAGDAQTGLSGAYFDNPSFEGGPAFCRVDPVVDFVWHGTTPVTGRLVDGFSVQWRGFLTPPVSGLYTLGARGFTAYKVMLDGATIAEYRGIHHSITQARAVELEAGRFYSIQLDYANRGPDPQVQLLWARPGRDDVAEALDVADKAEVVVMVMGISASLEGEEMPIEIEGFDRGDRTELVLPRPQRDLIRRIHALGKPTVLVLLNGSALAVNWANDNLPAIIEAWYPGQAGGDAIADVLFGDYNPGGRLPVTFYRSVDDLPDFEDYRMAAGHTYRYFRGEPLYPFGHGLSYTSFAYSDLALSAGRIAAGESVTVQVEVENVGQRVGDEVVQLYVRDVVASVPVPLRQLQGFQRVQLAPGERTTVTFTLTPRQMSLITDEGARVVEPGKFEIALGGGQPGYADVLTEVLEVVGQTTPVEG